MLLVAYQEGQPDQFLHRYEYDAENRLLAVFTSADGVDWDQDATYAYYTHGPLKRAVLGQEEGRAWYAAMLPHLDGPETEALGAWLDENFVSMEME